MTSFAKSATVAMARKRGWTDEEILKHLVMRVYGSGAKKQLIVDWAEALGRTPSEALQLARRANLISTSSLPRGSGPGKPLRKTPESDS
jgi:hypothetical protein